MNNLPINQIICGECSEIMSTFPEDCIDLTVTSPPYNSIRKYHGFDFNFEPIAHQLYRITKPGGVVVWVVGDQVINGSETGESFRQALYFKEINFKLHDTMIYQKTGVSYPDTVRYYQNFEYCFILSKGKPKTINLLKDSLNNYHGCQNWGVNSRRNSNDILVKSKKEKRMIPKYGIRYNVWKINGGFMHTCSDSELHKKHPAIFPESLARDHILSWSNPGDLVLDCFSGSGTTSFMSIKTGRNFIGIDISQDYCDLSEQRTREVQKEIW